MARKNGDACANPKQIRTDVDCRAARPKFDNGAWSAAKISDVTGGGLYLFVTPDESGPGNAASKLWRMGYRFHSRQKTYSIGPYGNGKDGTFSLADARRERDKAKDLLKDGKDPSTEKQLVKHRQAAARPFEQWADEWLAKKKVEKVKRGRIVAVRDPKTIEVLGLRVGYIKGRFGKLCRQDIKRPDVLAFMRSYEAEGKLETRDRVRSIGEQICNYADVEGDGYNPFRNLNGQMIANISTPRPGVTEPRDVTRVFKLISAPWTRSRAAPTTGHKTGRRSRDHCDTTVARVRGGRAFPHAPRSTRRGKETRPVVALRRARLLQTERNTMQAQPAPIARAPGPESEPTTALVREALSDVREVVRLEVALARREFATELAGAKAAAIALGTASATALIALTLLLVAVVLALPVPWIAALALSAVLLAVAIGLGVVGWRTLPKKPLQKTRNRIETDIAETKGRLT